MASEADVIAATREWVEKAVIDLNLCPFARSVWVKNQVRIVVSTARHVDGLLDDLDPSWTCWPARQPRRSTPRCWCTPPCFPIS